jgi:acyl carrier protein
MIPCFRAANVEAMSEIERDVRTFIRENYIVTNGELGAGDSLTGNGVLDSMGVLELIMFVEERFGVKVPDEDTLPENLDSVDRIVGYLERRLAANDG